MIEEPDFHSLLGRVKPDERLQFFNSLGLQNAQAVDGDWSYWAHDGQKNPPGDWRTWVIMAGRGFGKTRAGAEWVAHMIDGSPDLRIALVGASIDEARRVMVDGKSGLLSVANDLVAQFHPSRRLLQFKNGAEATLFSGASPESLRGPEHHFAWCDELAKWEKPGETWDMLQLGCGWASGPARWSPRRPGRGRR